MDPKVANFFQQSNVLFCCQPNGFLLPIVSALSSDPGRITAAIAAVGGKLLLILLLLSDIAKS
jgi:hypothetical protein